MTASPSPSGFRRFIIPSVVVAAGLAILIGLGLWQLERLAWKENLIATLHERLAAAPADLPPAAEWPKLKQDASEFRRVTLRAEFLDRPPVYVYAGAPALRGDIKSPGYFVFAPARLPGGETVVVNAGYVPLDRTYQWASGGREIIGYLRWPEPSGWFVSDHDSTGDIWFVRDHRAMAALKGWGGQVAPFYIDQEGPVPANGLPRPGPLTVNLRNNHLGYAWTWLGLAGALAAVFAFWLWSQRRKTIKAESNPSL